MIALILLLASFVLIILCGVFVAAEFSFVTVQRPKVNKLALQGDEKAASIKIAISRLSTQLSSAQLGITLTSLTVGLLAEPTVARIIGSFLESLSISRTLSNIIAVVLSISLATIITMIFGELIPKNLAISYPLQTAKFVVSFQRSFTYVMTYPIAVINTIANSLLRAIGIKPKEHLNTARSQDELVSVIKHSAQKGTLPKNIASLIKSSLEFGQKKATDVMTPRLKIIYLNQDSNLSAILQKAKQSGHSKFPVIDTSIDRVVGTIQLKDVYKINHSKRSQTKIKNLMQPALYLPYNIELNDLLISFRGKSTQLAIVIDEFGGTAGIVTAEDLTEELVGEVRDEHDKIDPVFHQLNKDQWELSGLLRPDEVSEIIGLTIPENEDYETIGGLLLDRLGKIPTKNDYTNISIKNTKGISQTIKLSVSRMDRHRVDKLILNIVSSKAAKNE